MDSRDTYGLAFGSAYASVEAGCERSAALSELCGMGWEVPPEEGAPDDLYAYNPGDRFWDDVNLGDAPLPTEELLGADHPYVEYTATYDLCPTKLDIPVRRSRFISWVMT